MFLDIGKNENYFCRKSNQMKRTLWIERKFQFGIPAGWMPNVLNRLNGTEIRLEFYLNQINESQAEIKPNGKWSIKEEIGHLADLEILHLERIKDFEAKKAILSPADMKNLQTEKANHNEKNLIELFEDFKSKRKHLIQNLKNLEDEIQNFSSLHPRLKEMMKPVDMAFFTAEHDDHHLTSIVEKIAILN